MEKSNLKKSLVFATIIFCIGIAIRSLTNLFSGFGLSFVASIILFVLVFLFSFSNLETRKRMYDIYILISISTLLHLILFCAFDLATSYRSSLFTFINVFSNILAIYSLFALTYTLVRLFSEINNKKIMFVEIILGNEKIEKKEKSKIEKIRQPKEVISGELEQKPIVEKENFNNHSEQTMQSENPVQEQPINNAENDNQGSLRE